MLPKVVFDFRREDQKIDSRNFYVKRIKRSFPTIWQMPPKFTGTNIQNPSENPEMRDIPRKRNNVCARPHISSWRSSYTTAINQIIRLFSKEWLERSSTLLSIFLWLGTTKRGKNIILFKERATFFSFWESFGSNSGGKGLTEVPQNGGEESIQKEKGSFRRSKQ